MKFYAQLLFAGFMFLGTLLFIYFLIIFKADYLLIGIMVFSSAFLGYLIIRILKNYSKILQDRNTIVIKTLFGVKSYNLDDLVMWKSFDNIYRVRYLLITLIFKGETVKIMDTSDPINVQRLYHYLRTHYMELNRID
ncbi:hypothetical protein [Cognataquiflexum rubidum]|jgi:Ca2+/Na+ antiporter|uniref:hypothetical protein n=1 Tax=Cognataquiflexum rubidum TaxID=2922273 RepID=UPI001F130EF7|nr:hypothetical protein [Cognataquiflexum rubidum]MCH6235561.1 hypothetical protein [Cognataquiflexum rubidum]